MTKPLHTLSTAALERLVETIESNPETGVKARTILAERNAQATAAAQLPQRDGDLGRAQRMLAVPQGRATITISNPRGGHATFKIKAAKGKHAGRTFVEVPDESAEWGWRSVGEVIGAPMPFASFKPYRGTSEQLAYAIGLVLRGIYDPATDLDTVNGGPYAVQVADTCGACGRELTHPDSIPVGIGPDCAERLGRFHPGYSSQHVATRTRKAS